MALMGPRAVHVYIIYIYIYIQGGGVDPRTGTQREEWLSPVVRCVICLLIIYYLFVVHLFFEYLSIFPWKLEPLPKIGDSKARPRSQASLQRARGQSLRMHAGAKREPRALGI